LCQTPDQKSCRERAEVEFHRRITTLTRFTVAYVIVLNDALSKAIIAGDNLLAVHCHNTAGGQFIDAGIEIGTELQIQK